MFLSHFAKTAECADLIVAIFAVAARVGGVD